MKLSDLKKLCDELQKQGFDLSFAEIRILVGEMQKLIAVAEAGAKIAAYIEECYPGIAVTESIREALAALEAE